MATGLLPSLPNKPSQALCFNSLGLFYCRKTRGRLMQEHEKMALQLILMGVVIAMAKVLISTEKLTLRVVLGRAILNGFTTLGAGGALIWISDLNMLAILGLGAFLGTLGSQFVEAQAEKFIKEKVGSNEDK